MSLDGALFDLPKLRNISKDVLSYLDAPTISKMQPNMLKI